MPERQPPGANLSSDLDETSLSPAAVVLEEHGRAVGERTRQIAQRIGLRPDLADVVERAGALHDIGKADARFQRWLYPEGSARAHGQVEDAPPSLGGDPRRVGMAPERPPRGSIGPVGPRLAGKHPSWGDPERRDLLLHQVISHHGKGRPLVPPVPDGAAEVVYAEVEGASVKVKADLAIVDWTQPGRFRQLNDRFGPWGLALLEAIVRLADHAVSAGADVSADAPR